MDIAASFQTHQLVRMFRPGQVAHLGVCVHTVQRLAGQRVPEPYAAVSSSPAAGQQAVLVRRPGYGLHRGQVLHVGLDWGRAGGVPNKQAVVVATGRQVLVVR